MKIQWDPKVTLGNVLTAVAMLGTLVAGYINIKSEVQASAARIEVVARQVEPVDALETRMAVVERNQVTGREQMDSIARAVDELRKQNLEILTELAAISATLDERDRGR